MDIMKYSLLLIAAALSCQLRPVQANSVVEHQSTPVNVAFGVRALTPDTQVNPQVAFVAQMLTLPPVVCTTCSAQDSWTRDWSVSHISLNRDHTQLDKGWYLFNSGLKGIGIGVRTAPGTRQTREGTGARLDENGEVSVGLVRLARDVGAGLVDLPATDFTRVTTFRDPAGSVKYVQRDTFQVSADFRVPTCTSSTRSLSIRLPDIDRGWLRNNVVPGHYADRFGSAPQLVVANCSENTRNLRIRFIPGGAVADSVAGPATILVGRDADNRDTGTGFLTTYAASGFGRTWQGVVHWDRALPLVLTNPHPAPSGDELSEGITVALQGFYARPDNSLPLGAGAITARGLYQVSYD
ncbi:hypothetical protein [Serratia sp. 1D1416]|uniref:hypothetical protein n=1 Tax=Serratia sp. 1D1416 TaxID=2447890 RepID=UPI001013C56D|nr:hypothetical protein [Serratia sp. 1D1416]